MENDSGAKFCDGLSQEGNKGGVFTLAPLALTGGPVKLCRLSVTGLLESRGGRDKPTPQTAVGVGDRGMG